MTILGIDFGTSNSCAAFGSAATELKIVRDGEYDEMVPSCVFVESAQKKFVGRQAEFQAKLKPQCFHDGLKKDLLSNRRVYLGGTQYDPPALIALVLAQIAANARAANYDYERVVITIPATYTEREEALMRKSAELAGLESPAFMTEPEAAAAYYASKSALNLNTGQRALVYDFGGGTFDATIIERTADGYRLPGHTAGIVDCGGTDIDRRLLDTVLAGEDEGLRQEILESKTTRGLRLLHELVSLCRQQIKHGFADASLQDIELPLPFGMKQEGVHVTRAEFDRLIDPFITQTIDCCTALLSAAKIRQADLAAVLLVGGSSNLLAVKERISATFKCDVLRLGQPELVVCLGAAVAGSIETRANTTHETAAPPPVVESLPKPQVVPSAPQKPTERGVVSAETFRRAAEVEVLLQAGRLDEAFVAAQSFLDQDENNALAHASKGRVLRKKGDLTRAQASFERSVTLDPWIAASWSELGQVRFDLQNYRGAVEALTQGLSHKPTVSESDELYMRRALTRTRLDAWGDVSDAADDLSKLSPKETTLAILALRALLLDKCAGDPAKQVEAAVAAINAYSEGAFYSLSDVFKPFGVDLELPQALRDRLNNDSCAVAALHQLHWSALKRSVVSTGKPLNSAALRVLVERFWSRQPRRAEWKMKPEFAQGGSDFILNSLVTLGQSGSTTHDELHKWWKQIFVQNPGLTLPKALGLPGLVDAARSKAAWLSKLCTPQISCDQTHGSLLGSRVGITNTSAFPLTGIVVKVDVSRHQGPNERFEYTHGLLRPDERQGWEGVIKNPGFMGSGFKQSRMTVSCAEGVLTLTGEVNK